MRRFITMLAVCCAALAGLGAAPFIESVSALRPAAGDRGHHHHHGHHQGHHGHGGHHGKRPKVTWSFRTAQIEAGEKPRISYRAKHLTGQKLVLQAAGGKGWTQVARLHLDRHGRGSWTGRPAAQGRVQYRIVAKKSHGRKGATSPAQSLFVNAWIPLSAVTGVQPRSVAIGGTQFSYVASGTGWSHVTLVDVADSSCRAAKLNGYYSYPEAGANLAALATMKVVTRSGEQSVNVGAGSGGSLASALDDGVFQVVAENAPGAFYVNGQVDCWSGDGRAGGLAVPSSRVAAARTDPSRDSADALGTPLKGGTGNPVENAISWALNMEKNGGHPETNTHCQEFVHNAYKLGAGVEIGYTDAAPNDTAIDFFWMKKNDPYRHLAKTEPDPPAGALVYWSARPHHPEGHVGISLGDGRVVSTGERDVNTVHEFSIAERNATPGYEGSYVGWLSPPGLDLNNANAARSQWMGYIVQWDGDHKDQQGGQLTSWLVVPVNGYVRRAWIPDIKTYWCLVRRGAPGPVKLPSAVLTYQMPDQFRTATAGCDSSVNPGGRGGDDASEQAGSHGAPTFSSYHTAAGPGPAVPAGTYVSVACKVHDGNVASSNPDGYWYRLDGDPWNGAYYAPANVFMNGDPWGGPYSHNTDFAVPDCGKEPGGGGGGGGGGTIPVGTHLEQQGHHGVNTFSSYHSASGPGPVIASGQYVDVECKVHDGNIASSNPDGYWYRISSSPWNSAYYAPANTFMNGDPWNGPYSHNTDFNVPDCATSVVTTPPPPGETTYAEVQGHHGVNTFSNYHNASGQGPSIAAGATVQVSCKVLDGTIASVNPDGYWYKIATSPWNDAYYAPANTFMNGDPANGPYTHNTDFGVPTCGGSPPPPPTTWQEQEGSHGVNTFTNYHNASGQGPAIGAGAWVTVSCKVYDPTIGSVNPDGYWYRIATSPWNNAYYAPANTFMNGDPWGGPYSHNTDFNVANC